MSEVGQGGVLSARTCGIHPTREAVARCPSCEGYFCRECITEHDFRMICAGCLAELLDGGGEEKTKSGVGIAGPVLSVLQVAAGVVVVWFVCFTLAELLRELPPELHSGSMFEEIMMEAQRAALEQ